MAFRTIFGLLVPFFFIIATWADTIKLNPSHPDQYTVVKGDTLWGISGKFLEHPWQWPEIWSVNSQIKNPHLIYPGDIIRLTWVDGQPVLSVYRGEDGRLHPRPRESSLAEAIKLIPIEVIAPFLTSPKVVTENEFEAAPYVVEFVGEHMIAGAGDRIYVRSIEQPESLNYTVFRKGIEFIRPETGEHLGLEAIYIADTTLQRAGDPATLYVNDTSKEIRKGDRVMTHDEGEVALNYFPQTPEKKISASIISVLDGVSQIGQFNIIVIDRGIVDGLEPGNLMEIFQKRDPVSDPFSAKKYQMVDLPLEHAGTLMVFRTFEKVSYAIVLEATAAMHIFDKAQTH